MEDPKPTAYIILLYFVIDSLTALIWPFYLLPFSYSLSSIFNQHFGLFLERRHARGRRDRLRENVEISEWVFEKEE